MTSRAAALGRNGGSRARRSKSDTCLRFLESSSPAPSTAWQSRCSLQLDQSCSTSLIGNPVLPPFLRDADLNRGCALATDKAFSHSLAVCNRCLIWPDSLGG